MMRLTAAAAVLAFAAAHPAPLAKPPHAAPVRIVRAAIVSGDGQSAHAYAASGRKRYQSDFPAALVVRIPSQPHRKTFFHVIFTCVTKECTFAPTDQPDHGDFLERVKDGGDDSPNAYDVKVHNGVAALRVMVEAPAIENVTVRAQPVTQKGERAVPASFVLHMR